MDKFSVIDSKGQIQTGKFSDALLKDLNVVKINGQLYVYDEQHGIYVSKNAECIIEKKMIEYFPEINQNIRKETLSKIFLKVKDYDDEDNDFSHLIVFRNGVYNLVTGALEPFNKDYMIYNAIPHDYNPSAYSSLVDDMMTKLTDGDAELRLLLEEIVGYAMYRSCEKSKAFFFWGPKGNNGKSVYQSLLINLLGKKNISTLDLANISKDKFATSQLFGKLANIADDIEDNFIGNSATFKSLCTGERITAEQKFKDAFEFNPYATLIFSANNLPRLAIDGGVMRRMVIVPFNHDFKKDADFNPNIKNHLLHGIPGCSTDDNFSYLINLGLAGLSRILADDFTHSDKCDKSLAEYNAECNPIEEFVEEWNDQHAKGFDEIIRSDAYNSYKLWSENSGQKPLSQMNFTKYICVTYGYECRPFWHQLQGTKRTFVKKED